MTKLYNRRGQPAEGCPAPLTKTKKDTMVRYALIGYGKIAQVHAKALDEAKDSTLVAVWGRNKGQGRTLCQRVGHPSLYGHAEDDH